MDETRRNILVGMFVLAGLAALATLILWFGQAGGTLLGARGYVIHADFEAAPGIRAGTIVTVGGIEVGRVFAVDFKNKADYESGVRVTITLNDGRILHEGARAVTVEPGLGMGRPPIVIYPGPLDAPAIVSGGVIPGTVSGAVESLIPPDLLAKIDRTAIAIADAADGLQPVLQDVHEILQSRRIEEVDMPGGPPGNLASAMSRLDSALKHFNLVLGDPLVQSHLLAAVDNVYVMTDDGRMVMSELRAGAGEVKQIVTDTRNLIEQLNKTATRTDEQLDRVARSLQSNLEQISTILTSVQATTARVERGEGTVGKLLADDKLYEAAVLTVRRLADTIEEFRLLAVEWRQGKIRVAF